MPKVLRKSTRNASRAAPSREPKTRAGLRKSTRTRANPSPATSSAPENDPETRTRSRTHRADAKADAAFAAECPAPAAPVPNHFSTWRDHTKPPFYTGRPWERSTEVVEADPNCRTRLFSLPRELVLEIAEHLPLVGKICLTLTCKEATNILGTESWDEFRRVGRWDLDLSVRWIAESTIRGILLQALMRDRQGGLEYCERCNTLHPHLPAPCIHRETRLTKTCYGQWATIDYLPTDGAGGYGLVLQHIEQAMEESEEFAKKGLTGPAIHWLTGDFTVSKNEGKLGWELHSRGARVDGNLVIQHKHVFYNNSRPIKPLQVTDVLNLPIRLCPHQSTTTHIPAPSRYINRHHYNEGQNPNAPLLTHAIISALPASMAKTAKANLNLLRKPTASEQQQMALASTTSSEDIIYKCRFCPTKYRVEFRDPELHITTWHSSGRDMVQAVPYWKMFVRRTALNLAREKRNDEWWAQSRSIPDFKVEQIVDNWDGQRPASGPHNVRYKKPHSYDTTGKLKR